MSGNSLLNVASVYFANGTQLGQGSYQGDFILAGNLNMSNNSEYDVNTIYFINGHRIGNGKYIGTLGIQGDLSYTGSLSSLSDYRVKESVTSLTASEFSVDELNPVWYKNKVSGREETGFIAHELQTVFPHLVNREKDGESYQTINYLGLIAILTKEVQELKQKVRGLEVNSRCVPP
jgi:hypothetical protein